VDAPVHFAASKAAVRGFSEALAREIGRYGITVNCLAPGLTDGGLSARLPASRRRDYIRHCALGRVGALEEMAKIVLWMISDEQSSMTGATVVADGGV
jgi:NAD(P)-dependent dehydrogenase (short-subunit alcohol dehydrogenase family)